MLARNFCSFFVYADFYDDSILTKSYHYHIMMIGNIKNPIIDVKGGSLLNVTQEDVANYLAEVQAAVKASCYQISPRQKNQELYFDYVFHEGDEKEILLSLQVDDFSEVVQNNHPQHPEEILYIFGKEVSLMPRFGQGVERVSLYIKFNKLANQYVIVISLHKQEYPLKYQFK